MKTPNRPIRIFLCYAREDETLLKELEKQLRLLERQGWIEIWYDREISPGANWTQEIKRYLNRSDIILLLVSPDFINSDYCYGVEMQRAMERHQAGEACVIPVILRHVSWQNAPFGKIQALPTNAKPVTGSSWHSREEAFYDVAENIRKVVEKLMMGSAYTPSINPVENETKNAQGRALQPIPVPLSPIHQSGSGLLPINPPLASPPPLIVPNQPHQQSQYQQPLAAPSQIYQQLPYQQPFDAITANMKTSAGLPYLVLVICAFILPSQFIVTYLFFLFIVLLIQYRSKKPSRFIRFHMMHSVLLGGVGLLPMLCLNTWFFVPHDNATLVQAELALLSFCLFLSWIIVQVITMVRAFRGEFIKLPFLWKFAAKFAERRLPGG